MLHDGIRNISTAQAYLKAQLYPLPDLAASGSREIEELSIPTHPEHSSSSIITYTDGQAETFVLLSRRSSQTSDSTGNEKLGPYCLFGGAAGDQYRFRIADENQLHQLAIENSHTRVHENSGVNLVAFKDATTTVLGTAERDSASEEPSATHYVHTHLGTFSNQQEVRELLRQITPQGNTAVISAVSLNDLTFGISPDSHLPSVTIQAPSTRTTTNASVQLDQVETVVPLLSDDGRALELVCRHQHHDISLEPFSVRSSFWKFVIHSLHSQRRHIEYVEASLQQRFATDADNFLQQHVGLEHCATLEERTRPIPHSVEKREPSLRDCPEARVTLSWRYPSFEAAQEAQRALNHLMHGARVTDIEGGDSVPLFFDIRGAKDKNGEYVMETNLSSGLQHFIGIALARGSRFRTLSENEDEALARQRVAEIESGWELPREQQIFRSHGWFNALYQEDNLDGIQIIPVEDRPTWAKGLIVSETGIRSGGRKEFSVGAHDLAAYSAFGPGGITGYLHGKFSSATRNEGETAGDYTERTFDTILDLSKVVLARGVGFATGLLLYGLLRVSFAGAHLSRKKDNSSPPE